MSPYYQVGGRRHGQLVRSNIVSATLMSPQYTTYSIPATIDPTGSTDVTAALQAWINSVPNGTEGRPNILQFGSTATYLTQTEILLQNRQHLVFEGDGCHFVRTFYPYTATSTTVALSSASWSGGVATFVAAASLMPIDTFGMVKTTGCTPAGYNGTFAVASVVNDTTVTVAMADPGSPTASVVGDIQRLTRTNHHLRITDDGTQANPSRNITLRNFTIDGPNDAVGADGHVPFDAAYEFQNGVHLEGLEGCLVDNVTVNNVGGDGILNQARNPDAGVFFPSSDVTIRNSTVYWIGRQGMTLYGLAGPSNWMKNCTINDVGRSSIDHEPPGSETGHAYVQLTVEDLTILNHFGGDTIIAAQGGGAENWGPLTYRRIAATSGGKADQFFKSINGNGSFKRGPLTLEDITFVGVGAASSGGLWGVIHLAGSAHGWKDVVIRNSSFELTQVTQDVGGVKLQNCSNVSGSGLTFTNVYDYGGTPSWYGDAGGNSGVAWS